MFGFRPDLGDKVLQVLEAPTNMYVPHTTHHIAHVKGSPPETVFDRYVDRPTALALIQVGESRRHYIVPLINDTPFGLYIPDMQDCVFFSDTKPEGTPFDTGHRYSVDLENLRVAKEATPCHFTAFAPPVDPIWIRGSRALPKDRRPAGSHR